MSRFWNCPKCGESNGGPHSYDDVCVCGYAKPRRERNVTEPYKVDADLTVKVYDMVKKSPEAFQLLTQGWRFFGVNQNCGRCSYGPKWITVPKWAFDRGESYAWHVFCHEVAHALCPVGTHHGIAWLDKLVEICKCGLCLSRESNYKPRTVRQYANGRRG